MINLISQQFDVAQKQRHPFYESRVCTYTFNTSVFHAIIISVVPPY